MIIIAIKLNVFVCKIYLFGIPKINRIQISNINRIKIELRKLFRISPAILLFRKIRKM